MIHESSLTALMSNKQKKGYDHSYKFSQRLNILAVIKEVVKENKYIYIYIYLSLLSVTLETILL